MLAFLWILYRRRGPIGWFSGGHSPDWFQGNCGYGNNYSAPLNQLGFQHAQDGLKYTGVVTYQHPIPWREYVVIELIEPLAIGQTYNGSFYANPGWNGTAQLNRLATNNIGMLFTMEPRGWVWGDPLTTTVGYAHIQYPEIIADTVAWTLVSGNFVADSAYRYVSIGNHFSNAETDTLPLTLTSHPPLGYSFIDNVCVSINSGGCPMATSVHSRTVEGMVVYPNPATTELVLDGRQLGQASSLPMPWAGWYGRAGLRKEFYGSMFRDGRGAVMCCDQWMEIMGECSSSC